MSSVVISGDTSGTVTLAAPAVAGSNTLTLQAATATSSVNTLATAVATTSGTSIDYTGFPSWIKRITVMFNGASTNGAVNKLLQIGTSGGIQSTSYDSLTAIAGPTAGQATSTAGFILFGSAASEALYGHATITLVGSNLWIYSSTCKINSSYMQMASGSVTLSGTLDRIRLTTTNGTDTFDAGSVNLLYEG
jgi:hypothetical protein